MRRKTKMELEAQSRGLIPFSVEWEKFIKDEEARRSLEFKEKRKALKHRRSVKEYLLRNKEKLRLVKRKIYLANREKYAPGGIYYKARREKLKAQRAPRKPKFKQMTFEEAILKASFPLPKEDK